MQGAEVAGHSPLILGNPLARRKQTAAEPRDARRTASEKSPRAAEPSGAPPRGRHTPAAGASASPAVPPGGTWSGRFSEPMTERMQRFNASVDFDRRLAAADIAGSTRACADARRRGDHHE